MSPSPESTKACSRCGEVKSLNVFAKGSQYNKGIKSQCKACDLVSSAASYRRHRVATLARMVLWRRANPDKVRAQASRWARANPIKRSAKEARRRAIQVNAPGRGISAAEWQQILADSIGLCAYCNGRPTQLTLDHIEPLALGGEHGVDNAAAACLSCNSSKGDTPLLVWLATRAILRSEQQRAA